MGELHWLFSATSAGSVHVRVAVRCGAQPQDRPLLGYLMMSPAGWADLCEIVSGTNVEIRSDDDPEWEPCGCPLGRCEGHEVPPKITDLVAALEASLKRLRH